MTLLTVLADGGLTPTTMKIILITITITIVCAYAVCVVNIPGVTHAFDKGWDCSTPVVCIKKS